MIDLVKLQRQLKFTKNARNVTNNDALLRRAPPSSTYRTTQPLMSGRDDTSTDELRAFADSIAIREGLETHAVVRMRCEDESEAAMIKRYLTQEEQDRVTFVWGADEDQDH